MAEEKLPISVPIVEHLPNGQEPHPKTDGMPAGTVGHPGEHLEHEAITHEGKVVAIPHEGHGEKVETVPSPEEVEKLLKQSEEETAHWLGKLIKRKAESEKLKAAA